MIILNFPWVILIPRINKITDMSDLNFKDQILLMKEIILCKQNNEKII